MTFSRTKQAAAYAGCQVALMDRVKNLEGALITQASVSSLSYRVDRYSSLQDAEECENGTETADDTALTPKSSYIFDTLQTAAPWDSTKDASGYNVRVDLPGASRPTGNCWHRYELTITPSTGEAFKIVWIIQSEAVSG